MIFYDAASDILNQSVTGAVGDFNVLIRIIQALGGVIVVYIIFNIIMVMINRKRNKKILKIVNEVSLMKKNLSSMDKSLKEIKVLLGKKK